MAYRGPSDVLLDTSVIAAAIVPGLPHAAACASFCRDLVADGTTIYFSRIVRLEFGQLWSRLPTSQYLPSDVQRRFYLGAWSKDPTVRLRWMAHGVSELERLLGGFNETFELPFDLTTWRASIDVMARHRLRSHDALHIASALAVRVNDVATLDDHFRRVSNLRVWLLHAPRAQT
jgi:predicted nucleic acid-binding protein